MLTDYHIHVEQGPYTVEWLSKFARRAEAAGIEEWGISEHAYRFVETRHIFWNDWVEARQNQRMEEYLEMILKARQAGIRVKFGIEMDYFPGKEKEIEAFIKNYPFDYVIGSVHWIDEWGIDLSEMKEEWNRRKVEEVWLAYFERVESLAQSKLFDIAGHLDLAKIFKYVPEDVNFLKELYDRVARLLAANGTCIEISTAGLRKPVGEIYPHPLLLEACYKQGVPIVISSDAHCPKDVGANFSQAVALAKRVGYREIQVFSNRQAVARPLG
ncbi:histidinol-phosphatase [Desulforamulus hydrothermalis]|uniref:Histidinol-phosphatase n=1 Tax=Desulforamulus hydrothermalis Lam5 = DSM 18033 TaxID=1121428 RepID=K8DY41_9FIRM|nr:histidinol-phosphatase [Desulforamulus hydrothermalis]CCO07649.1 Histidinol phosphate phosphatase HisJ family [Desulforamulus hydrothermalis Lam5 = DSM 18033]SHH24512.1 histidinol-phosphatase (PHP family) [Desulforamulus hydrothermalis Lam5 = DSM 18033]